MNTAGINITAKTAAVAVFANTKNKNGFVRIVAEAVYASTKNKNKSARNAERRKSLNFVKSNTLMIKYPSHDASTAILNVAVRRVRNIASMISKRLIVKSARVVAYANIIKFDATA